MGRTNERTNKQMKSTRIKKAHTHTQLNVLVSYFRVFIILHFLSKVFGSHLLVNVCVYVSRIFFLSWCVRFFFLLYWRFSFFHRCTHFAWHVVYLCIASDMTSCMPFHIFIHAYISTYTSFRTWFCTLNIICMAFYECDYQL